MVESKKKMGRGLFALIPFSGKEEKGPDPSRQKEDPNLTFTKNDEEDSLDFSSITESLDAISLEIDDVSFDTDDITLDDISKSIGEDVTLRDIPGNDKHGEISETGRQDLDLEEYNHGDDSHESPASKETSSVDKMPERGDDDLIDPSTQPAKPGSTGPNQIDEQRFNMELQLAIERERRMIEREAEERISREKVNLENEIKKMEERMRKEIAQERENIRKEMEERERSIIDSVKKEQERNMFDLDTKDQSTPSDIRNRINRAKEKLKKDSSLEKLRTAGPFSDERENRKLVEMLSNYEELAQDAIMRDELEKALNYYDRMVELEPMYDIAWNNRGVVLKNLGKPKSALKSYIRAIKINPQYGNAWYNMGIALEEMEEYAKALKCFDSAMRFLADKDKASQYRKACKDKLASKKSGGKKQHPRRSSKRRSEQDIS